MVAIEQTAAVEIVVGHFVGQLVMDERSVTSSGGGSREDVFIARFDGAGNVLSLWREDPLHVDAILLEPDGSLWISGRENNLTSNRIWKLRPDGQRQLSLDVNDEGSAYGVRLASG